jgi:predicted glycosyltransferase involved in capsule biosynthesis
MDKITYEYNKDFADRVAGLRDEFAMHGHRDFKLEYRINTAVVDTDQMMEIADRLMGLAFRELAKRQLRVTTMKQLCCD